MIAEIHTEVHGLVEACESQKVMSKLAIQMKPSKSVIAKASFAKGKLVLVPDTTMKVAMRKSKPEPMANAVRVHTLSLPFKPHIVVAF